MVPVHRGKCELVDTMTFLNEIIFTLEITVPGHLWKKVQVPRGTFKSQGRDSDRQQ
jgi:hypothetical protein